MYNMNNIAAWDDAAAAKAKTSTLALIIIQLVSLILGIVTTLLLSQDELVDAAINANPAINTPEMRQQFESILTVVKPVTLVLTVLITALFVGLLMAKIKKLDRKVVPTKGVYIVILVFAIFGLFSIPGQLANGFRGILNVLFTLAELVLAIIAISAISKLKRAAFINGNNPYMNPNFNPNMNQNNPNMYQNNPQSGINSEYVSSDSDMVTKERGFGEDPLTDQVITNTNTIANPVPGSTNDIDTFNNTIPGNSQQSINPTHPIPGDNNANNEVHPHN